MKKRGALIVSDPEILGGTPVFAGTRIPAGTIAAFLRKGHTCKEILEHYDLDEAELAAFAMGRWRESQEDALAEIAKFGQEQELLELIARLRDRSEELAEHAGKGLYYEIDPQEAKSLHHEIGEAIAMLAAFHRAYFGETE